MPSIVDGESISLESLAQGVFQSLTKTELGFLGALEAGLDSEPADGDDARLRAEVLSWACTDASAIGLAHRRGLLIEGYEITGVLDLIFADVPFQLDFRACIFDQVIWMKASTLVGLIFRGCYLKGLVGDSSQIRNNLLFIDKCVSSRSITFRGAQIGGDLRMDDGIFSGSGEEAVVFDRSTIGGEVRLSRDKGPSSFFGEVRFASAEVGANFDCGRAKFFNPSGCALSADRISTKGSVKMSDARSSGQVVFGLAKIGTMLDCRGASFNSAKGRTLNAEKAVINSNVLLDNGFSCDAVHFLATSIGGGLRCCSAKISNLDARHAQVEDSFEWAGMLDAAESTVDLRGARVGSLKDDLLSWPPAGAAQFDGFRYERFFDSDSSLTSRLEWLSRDTSGNVHPYWQLSNVYLRTGRPQWSRSVLYASEKMVRSQEKNWIRTAMNVLLNVTVGYGYRLWRAAWLVGLIASFGFLVACVGYRAKLIAPTEKDANSYFVATGRSPRYYPRFSASVFSIENTIPALSLGVANAWSADTTAQWPNHPDIERFVRYWFWVQKALGWILSIFFVAGISGVIKSSE
jgi:hypothetical protein